jgi:hypothetical protein
MWPLCVKLVRVDSGRRWRFFVNREAMPPKVIKIKRRSVSDPAPAPATRTAARRPGTAGYGNQQRAKRKPQGGPPVALFVVIGFVVVLLIGLGVASSSSRRVQNRISQRHLLNTSVRNRRNS